MSHKIDDITTFLSVRFDKNEKKEFARLLIETERADDFLYCLLNGTSPVPERAAWVMTSVGDISPHWFNPYVAELITLLEKENHDAIERSVMRTLSHSTIPEEWSGRLLDICFEWLTHSDKLVAAKVYAMETAYQLSKDYPELLEELRQTILNEWDKNKVAFQSRGKRTLKRIKRHLDGVPKAFK